MTMLKWRRSKSAGDEKAPLNPNDSMRTIRTTTTTSLPSPSSTKLRNSHLLRPTSVSQEESRRKNSVTKTGASDATEPSSGSLRHGSFQRESSGSIFIYNPKSSQIGTSKAAALPKAAISAPNQLCGREEEMKTLRQSMLGENRNRDNSETGGSHRRSVILVGGESGAGKTFLVQHALRGAEDIISINGKYDLSQGKVPYLGITLALRELIDHLLESGISDDLRRTLKRNLGKPSLVSLSPLLPNLEHLLGEEYSANDQAISKSYGSNEEDIATSTVARIGEAAHRFRFAIHTFLWTIATSGSRTIVMFLDDLQWADEESFRLLHDLLQENSGPASAISNEGSELQNKSTGSSFGSSFVVVGCYRNNETSPQFKKWILDLRSNDEEIFITEISINNFTTKVTRRLVLMVLKISEDEEEDALKVKELDELALVVYNKTLGNPFFVIEFLKSLQQSEILDFDLIDLRWKWDIDELRSMTQATTNVVEHMKRKMEMLPQDISQYLPLAACLGSTFSAHTLAVVIAASHGQKENAGENSESEIDINKWIVTCVDLGFLLSASDQADGTGLFSWIHDKVQEAALSLVPKDSLDSVQFGVGEVLLQRLSRLEILANILVVVHLLIKGLPRRAEMNDKERTEIAQLCLAAGHIVMASACFSRAATFFKAGIAFLPGTHWATHAGLSLELYTSAVEAESCGGDGTSLQLYCNEVISQADLSIAEKFRAYDVLVPYTWSSNEDYEGAVTMALDVLDKLGCILPKRALLIHVIMGVNRMKKSMKKLDSNTIFSQEEMTDPHQIQTMLMLNRLATPAYNLKSLYLPLSILKSFELSIKGGMSEYSPVAFALVALILMCQLHDFELSRTYANYAVSLVESRDICEVAKSRTLFLSYGFVLHASVPYLTITKQLLAGYRSGLAHGNVEDAGWNALVYIYLCLQVGRDLNSLHDDMAVYTQQMDTLMQYQALRQIKQAWQVVQNLLGLADNPTALKGEAYEFDTDELDSALLVSTAVAAHQCHIYLSCFMCDDIAGADLVLDFYRKYKEEDMDQGNCLDDCLRAQAGVLCYGAARKTKKRKYLTRARKSHNHIRMISKKGNPNLLHMEVLLAAEYAAYRGRKTSAKQSYEAAIKLAARSGMIHLQALINERLADFLLDAMHDYNEALYRYKNAVALYEEWGAVVKVTRLGQKIVFIDQDSQVDDSLIC